MVCPLCRQRKARRSCPALGQQICAVCCGTKRLVEINCPTECVYLASARSHPPAVVQRQQDHDRGLLATVLRGLTDRQVRIFVLLATGVIRHPAEALHRLLDDDVAQAAEALAATLETATRGIVYEHRPASLLAERLLTDFRGLMAQLSKGGSALDRDAAIALRRMAASAREASRFSEGGETAFQQLLSRILSSIPAQPSAPAESPSQDTGPSLIIP